MATIDTTRNATNFAKHYTGSRMQQGRVLSDDDFNDHARLTAEDMRRTRLDVIGPAGSPDQGFLITNPVINAVGVPDFTIKAGTFYLGGQRLVLETDEVFSLQNDWLNQGAIAGDLPTVPTAARTDLAYLENMQVPVSAVEDTELLEVGLGGPDTSVRMRNLSRVCVVQGVTGASCAQSWAAVAANLPIAGTLDGSAELVTDVTLEIGSDGTSGSTDLCSPPVAGGYLGADNQTIRVQLTSNGTFTWGFNNAAPLYRVQLCADTTGQMRSITLLTAPKDQEHWPVAGQTVELLPWSAVLPNGQKLSEVHGHLALVVASYDPDAKQFAIDVAPPADASGKNFGETWQSRSDEAALNNEVKFFYLRVWDRGSDTTSPAQIPFNVGQPVSLAHTGLQVTFNGTQFRTDDFWEIAVRPDSPNTFVPWDLATGRPPQGVRRWFTPLALISWPGGNNASATVTDCRATFLPLTELQNCCTVTVGDGVTSHGDFTSIQAAVNSLTSAGSRVCILSGVYQENVQLLNLSGVTISGCGAGTVIQSKPPSGGATAADPVFYVAGGQDITIEALSVEADSTGPGIVILGYDNLSSAPAKQDATSIVLRPVLSNLDVTGGALAAVSARFVEDLTVRDCVIQNLDIATSEHTLVVLADDALITGNTIEVGDTEQPVEAAAVPVYPQFIPGSSADGGLHIEGTSTGVRVIDNLIRGGVGHGITLGTIVPLDANNNPVPPVGGTGYPDPCGGVIPGSTLIPTGGVQPVGSLGALADILIERNRILNMGLCGISVIGFFDLSRTDEFISVNGLVIIGNDIHDNVSRALAPIDPADVDMMGYGGIILADVTDLVIRDNSIVDNGLTEVEPVCGIFVLHGEGIEISRNRLFDGGPNSSSEGAIESNGRRGGINIVYALPPVLPITSVINEQNGVPAAKIHENIVSVMKGQALSLTGVGPMSVLGNQFTTRGVVYLGPSPTYLAATVGILNLGFSDEFYFQLLAFASIAQGNYTPSTFSGALSQTVSGLDDEGIGRLLADGNVLFSENQCMLDLIQAGMALAFSSIGIFSLDDIHFHGNQCSCNLLEDFILTHAFLFGFSVRMNDNRFKEGALNAMFSASELGIMASAVGNQSTHCLFLKGATAAFTVNTANINFTDFITPGACEGKQTTLFGTFSGANET